VLDGQHGGFPWPLCPPPGVLPHSFQGIHTNVLETTLCGANVCDRGIGGRWRRVSQIAVSGASSFVALSK
jgi:hypothetical protein